jgi:hypothetical protein
MTYLLIRVAVLAVDILYIYMPLQHLVHNPDYVEREGGAGRAMLAMLRLVCRDGSSLLR